MNKQQLKNSILQWAIQGRLVPQIASEGTAEDLLKEIRAEKERLVKEGKLKKKDLEVKPIEDDEVPFEIPESWKWVRLGDVFLHAAGKQLSGKGGEGSPYKYITTSNLYWGYFLLDDLKEMNFTEKELPRCTAIKGDLLVCEGGDVGRSAIWNYDYDICIQNHIHKLRPYISSFCTKFIYYTMMYNKETGLIGGRGIGIQGLSANVLKNIIVPFPSYSEQKRIVAKIEELMPLVEDYGKAQERLEALNKALPEKLKKSILQEAIMGKLVPQIASEGTAEDLLKEIRKKKERLVKEGKLKKKDLEVKPIEEDERLFEIPPTWIWCRLGEICSFLSRGKSPVYSDVPNQYPVFAQKCNLKDGGISLDQAKFLNPSTIGKWKEEFRLRTDDVLVNSTGKGTVCRTRLFHESYLGKYPFVVPDSHVSVVRTFDEICSSYVSFLFNTKEYQDYWEERLAGSTNQKELYIGTLYDTILPLPPLAEQKRIVAKVEELMKKIDNVY